MFRIRRPHALPIAATIATALSVGAALPSQAAQPDDPAVATARAFLTQWGADESTRDRLIDAHLAGETWDSMSSDNQAVAIREYTDSTYQYSVSTYRDGSIAVVREELPQVNKALSRGISGCSVSGTLRSNCKIDMWVGLVALSFYANYNLGNSTVSTVWASGWSIGGACGVSLLGLSRPTSSMARMDVSAQMCGVPYSTTFFLQLTLRSGTANVTWG